MRSGTPICGAASPTPGAAYIVLIMSSMSCWISGVISATGGRRAMQDVGAVAEDRPDHAAWRSAGAADGAAGANRPRPARRWPRSGARISSTESPPNFSRKASASTNATMASPTTAAAGTAQTSLRSMAAGAFCHRREVDRPQRLHQRGDRLHEAGDAHVLAVGDAAFEAAGVVGRPHRRLALRVAAAGSRRARASPGRSATSGPMPMPTALIAWMHISACPSRPSSLRSHCTYEPRPGGTPVAMISNAPPSVSPASRARSMAAIMRCSSAASTQRSGASSASASASANDTVAVARQPDVADGRDVAGDADAELRQQLAGERAGGDARRGFAGAGALEHVADVVVPVLERAGEIGVAGPRPRDVGAVGAGGAFRHLLLDVHRLLPVDPVAIADEQRDRRAGRAAPAHAREDLGAVAFDLHAAAAAVAALAPPQLALSASMSSSSPAGMPSTVMTSAWPCDSPAVRNLSIRAQFYTEEIALISARGPAFQARAAHARAPCISRSRCRSLPIARRVPCNVRLTARTRGASPTRAWSG